MRVLALTYHRVFPGHHMDPETFEYQISTLKKRFDPLSLNEAVEFAKGNLKLERPGFTVTFDDGWADNFIYAYQILKKHNVPATIFVPTDFINQTLHQERGEFRDSYEKAMREVEQNGHSYEFLSWDEIREMSPLVTIESHGHKHIHHPLNSPENIRADLATSIEKIEKETGRQPKYLAWPFGEYDRKTTGVAKETGFEACLTTRIGSISPGSNLFELNRFAPPRNTRAFRVATSGSFGMLAYKIAVALRARLG